MVNTKSQEERQIVASKKARSFSLMIACAFFLGAGIMWRSDPSDHTYTALLWAFTLGGVACLSGVARFHYGAKAIEQLIESRKYLVSHIESLLVIRSGIGFLRGAEYVFLPKGMTMSNDSVSAVISTEPTHVSFVIADSTGQEPPLRVTLVLQLLYSLYDSKSTIMKASTSVDGSVHRYIAAVTSSLFYKGIVQELADVIARDPGCQRPMRTLNYELDMFAAAAANAATKHLEQYGLCASCTADYEQATVSVTQPRAQSAA